MFNSIKNLFKRKIKKQYLQQSDLFITFDDLKGQTLNIRTDINGNDKILYISIDEKTIELAFNNELCLILSAIFSNFANNKSLNEIIQIIGENK